MTEPATDLLERSRRGDSSAAEVLLPYVYDELRRLAQRRLESERRDHTLEPTALVHEAYLKLIGQAEVRYRDVRHFRAIAATMMRRVLIDHARGKQRAKRGEAWQRVELTDGALVDEPMVEFLDLADALEELETLNERHARIVDMRMFGELTLDEIAEELELSRTTVKADWRVARAWLKRRLEGAPTDSN